MCWQRLPSSKIFLYPYYYLYFSFLLFMWWLFLSCLQSKESTGLCVKKYTLVFHRNESHSGSKFFWGSVHLNTTVEVLEEFFLLSVYTRLLLPWPVHTTLREAQGLLSCTHSPKECEGKQSKPAFIPGCSYTLWVFETHDTGKPGIPPSVVSGCRQGLQIYFISSIFIHFSAVLYNEFYKVLKL